MERVRDFSPYELKVSVYDGAAEKRTMLMDGLLYMVKFGYDAAGLRVKKCVRNRGFSRIAL